MRLFWLMVIVTTVEVLLISKVGGVIGALPTFLIIIGTALLGSRLLAKQWGSVMGKLQSLQGSPSDALVEALVLVICGVLLVTPGFLTDIIGFLGLVPTTREHLVTVLKKHGKSVIGGSKFTMYSSHSHFGQPQEPANRQRDESIIEGEFERKDDK